MRIENKNNNFVRRCIILNFYNVSTNGCIKCTYGEIRPMFGNKKIYIILKYMETSKDKLLNPTLRKLTFYLFSP